MSSVIYALTTSEVVGVSVAGGRLIATASNATLPDGLRAVAIEVSGYKFHPTLFTLPCPRLTPFDGKGRPIRIVGKPGSPLAATLPSKQWERPERPPRGVCGLAATGDRQRTVPDSGAVAVRTRTFRQLLGRAFFACADTTYIYREEHHLRSAVLLDAARPFATPPSLPGMRPMAGHAGIFEAPGAGGEMVARRIPGAWLVVEESDNIGLREPLELLEHLHGTIHR